MNCVFLRKVLQLKNLQGNNNTRAIDGRLNAHVKHRNLSFCLSDTLIVKLLIYSFEHAFEPLCDFLMIVLFLLADLLTFCFFCEYFDLIAF